MTGIATLHADMRAAFRKALRDIAGLPDQVEWEGKAFSPAIGVPFMSEGMVPVSSEPRAIGLGGTIRHRLLGTVNLFYPSNKGTLEAELATGLVLATFRPGTVLTYNGASGTVMKAEPRKILPDTDYLNAPVVVTILAYTAN